MDEVWMKYISSIYEVRMKYVEHISTSALQPLVSSRPGGVIPRGSPPGHLYSPPKQTSTEEIQARLATVTASASRYGWTIAPYAYNRVPNGKWIQISVRGINSCGICLDVNSLCLICPVQHDPPFLTNKTGPRFQGPASRRFT